MTEAGDGHQDVTPDADAMIRPRGIVRRALCQITNELLAEGVAVEVVPDIAAHRIRLVDLEAPYLPVYDGQGALERIYRTVARRYGVRYHGGDRSDVEAAVWRRVQTLVREMQEV